MRRRKNVHDVPKEDILTLKEGSGPIGETWLGRSFARIIEFEGEKGRLSRGRRCAQKGGGSGLRVEQGRVEMGICCSGYMIKDVIIDFPVLNEKSQEKLISTIVSDASLSGAMLVGALSQEFFERLGQHNIHLIPKSKPSSSAFCACGDLIRPCIHIIAAWYLFAEVLDKNPWYLLTLCGTDPDLIVEKVRQKLDIVSPARKVLIPRSGMDSDERIEILKTASPEGFFSIGSDEEDISLDPDIRSDISPIRLLGPSPFVLGGKNLADRIEDLYPGIQKYADHLMHRRIKKT